MRKADNKRIALVLWKGYGLEFSLTYKKSIFEACGVSHKYLTSLRSKLNLTFGCPNCKIKLLLKINKKVL
ncbi:hypothetical protein K737_300738 [Holospora undulata HU1]|uniref:Uncharacterized protein n=1 Tax=Holospora undulata HU1 TaxID=1321371 RepID=A0A061JHL3_9PROT|nr:hypothetical protein K737_300738 [Holospora undulata HU1]